MKARRRMRRAGQTSLPLLRAGETYHAQSDSLSRVIRGRERYTHRGSSLPGSSARDTHPNRLWENAPGRGSPPPRPSLRFRECWSCADKHDMLRLVVKIVSRHIRADLVISLVSSIFLDIGCRLSPYQERSLPVRMSSERCPSSRPLTSQVLCASLPPHFPLLPPPPRRCSSSGPSSSSAECRPFLSPFSPRNARTGIHWLQLQLTDANGAHVQQRHSASATTLRNSH